MVDENILKQQQKEFGMTVVFILFQQLKKQKHSLFQFSLQCSAWSTTSFKGLTESCFYTQEKEKKQIISNITVFKIANRDFQSKNFESTRGFWG